MSDVEVKCDCCGKTINFHVDYVIKARELKGDGSFRCPNCQMVIDPADDSGIPYVPILLDQKNNQLYLQCVCQKVIQLDLRRKEDALPG